MYKGYNLLCGTGTPPGTAISTSAIASKLGREGSGTQTLKTDLFQNYIKVKILIIVIITSNPQVPNGDREGGLQQRPDTKLYQPGLQRGLPPQLISSFLERYNYEYIYKAFETFQD